MGNALQVVPFNYPYGFIISTLVPIFAGRTAALTPLLTLSGVLDYFNMQYPPEIIWVTYCNCNDNSYI